MGPLVPWDMLGPYLKYWVCKLIIWMCEKDFAAFRDNLTKVSVSLVIHII